MPYLIQLFVHNALYQTSFQWIYILIILITVVEGPAIMLLSGFFVRLGYLGFFPAYFALMLGDLIGDAGWYAVGRFGGVRFAEKYGKYFSLTPEGLAKFENVFHRYKNSILLASKLTLGFGFAYPTLVGAGLAKIPFWRYMTLNLIGQFFLTGFLMFVGFSFGHLFSQINSILGKVSIMIFYVLISLVFLGIAKYLRQRRAERKNPAGDL